MQAVALVLVMVSGGWTAGAQDPGKEEIGKIRAELFFGTNGAADVAGPLAGEVPAAEMKKLQASKELRFASYRKLGEDRKAVWRAFENWAVPMKPSEEIMVSFEPKGVERNALRIDLKLWAQKREVLTVLPLLRPGKKLYILGPAWRGGRLIIAVELLELASQ
ncbi:MAG: hypothetical protein HKN82_10135 [Akkermansiaceae bacterium]|nr:hypothetical protein [Akkermansiaceae bacterium]NNM30333.1 hypothetical protein [Akkermansiaceae bacterium]